jgi:hypothetical protein
MASRGVLDFVTIKRMANEGELQWKERITAALMQHPVGENAQEVTISVHPEPPRLGAGDVVAPSCVLGEGEAGGVMPRSAGGEGEAGGVAPSRGVEGESRVIPSPGEVGGEGVVVPPPVGVEGVVAPHSGGVEGEGDAVPRSGGVEGTSASGDVKESKDGSGNGKWPRVDQMGADHKVFPRPFQNSQPCITFFRMPSPAFVRIASGIPSPVSI